MNKEIKTIVFDMDGTLYQSDGYENGFKGSSLESAVLENAIKFIHEREQCSDEEAKQLLDLTSEKRISISQFVSQRYGITREEYFQFVWNISPNGIVQNFEGPVEIVKKLKEQGKELILLTSAPEVWQSAVIAYLGLIDYFDEIYTGSAFLKKYEIFQALTSNRDPSTILSVGDQIDTDILPAQSLGLQTLHLTTPNDLDKLFTDIDNSLE